MYFIYKPININVLGGVFPKVDDIVFGLAEREGYYLGYTDNIDKLNSIKEYVVRLITDDEADGFKLLGVDKIIVDLNNIEIKTRPLNSEEIRKKKLAEKLMKKLKIRNKIYSELGDLEDIVADLSKRIELLERFVMIVFYDFYKRNLISKDVIKDYIPLLENYIKSINDKTIKSKLDFENIQELYNKIKNRFNKIYEIIEKELV